MDQGRTYRHPSDISSVEGKTRWISILINLIHTSATSNANLMPSL